MVKDSQKAWQMYVRRNAILRRMKEIATNQLNAVKEDRIDYFLQSAGERERYTDELFETENDITTLVAEQIRWHDPEVAALNTSAKDLLETIESLDKEMRKMFKMRLGTVSEGLSAVRRGRETLTAYRVSGESKRGQEISRQG